MELKYLKGDKYKVDKDRCISHDLSYNYLDVNNIATDLINKYSTNDYIKQRVIVHLQHTLPVILENELYKYDKTNKLNNSSGEFTSSYLNTCKYFYNSYTDEFYYYDGIHYSTISDDLIQYNVLDTLSDKRDISEWKYKIHKNIIKHIKNRPIINSIPDTATIQYVIDLLYPAIFPSRNHAKYLLAIIGECIINKHRTINNTINQSDIFLSSSPPNAMHIPNNDNIYIFPLSIKEIMTELNNLIYKYLGISNPFNNIKYKYHDHPYSKCRILTTDSHLSVYNSHNKRLDFFNALNKYIMGLLCVAVYYVNRYGNADAFIHNCAEVKFSEHVMFLTSNTPEKVVSSFISTLTQCYTHSIDSKMMMFLWKKYLENDLNIPNIMFHENLKTILKQKIAYDSATDSYVGYTSNHLPIVKQFIAFWDETITLTNVSNSCEEIIIHELDIDEINTLFKSYTNMSKPVNDTYIRELLCHYYPTIIINNDKHVNAKCNLWDKKQDVINAIDAYKNTHPDIDYNNKNEFIYNVYKSYCSIINKHKHTHTLRVNKKYFEYIANLILQSSI